MDLRSLIDKLDTIEQRKLLQESQQLMEKVRIRYSDVEAVANQYKDDEGKRLAALTKLIQDNNLPGLFDPIKKELVKPDGTYAWFAGADEATVKRLEAWGLLPPDAKTSSWLGARGEDEKTAQGANTKARSRDQMVDRAEELMKKAVQAAVAPAATNATADTTKGPNMGQVNKESKLNLANTLLEEFGYIRKSLLESITPDEHNELKQLIKGLTPFAATDPDAADIVRQFADYNKQRDMLIARIKEIITALQAKPAVKESLQESKTRMLAEGRIQILEEGKRYLRDGQEWTYDANTKMYSTILESGEHVELDEADFWQGAGDFSRGAASGLTLGYADNIAAGIKSVFKGTKYADELKRELATTDAVKTRSPWLYGAGKLTGFVANPLSKVGWGLPLIGAELASDKFIREPHNAATVAQAGQNTQRQGTGANPAVAPDPKVKALQQQLMQMYGPNAVGPHKDDGRMGPDTQKAIERAKKDGKMPGATTSASSSPTPEASIAAVATALGMPANSNFQAVQTRLLDIAKQGGADAVAKAVGATMNESKTAQQLEENAILRAGLEWLLKGGAEAGAKGAADTTVKAGAEALLKSGGEEVAKIGQSLLDSQGTTWVKRAGYWEPVAGPMKGFKNQIGLKSNPKVFAQLEAEFAAKYGIDAGVKAGAETAAVAGEEAIEAGLISKLGGKAKTALDAAKGAGGKLLPYLKNHKFLTAVALLGIAGYVFNGDGNIVPDTGGTTGGGDVNPNPAPGGEDPERKAKLDELQKLIDQLNGGWPTDAETAEVLKLANALGVKPNGATGREGSGANPATPARAPGAKPDATWSQEETRKWFDANPANVPGKK